MVDKEPQITALDTLLRATVAAELHKDLVKKYGTHYATHPALPDVLQGVAGKLRMIMGGYLDIETPKFSIETTKPKRQLQTVRCPKCRVYFPIFTRSGSVQCKGCNHIFSVTVTDNE